MAVKLSKKLKGLTSAEFKEGDNVTNITAGDVTVTKKEGNETKTLSIWDLSKTVETNAKATKVMVDGQEDRTDGNLKIKKTDTDGQLTYDLSLNDVIHLGKAGEDGKDGKDGKIGLTGKDGTSAEIRTGQGKAGVDGKDGETTTRIIYKDKDGKDHEVATLDDGLKFKGDNDTVVTRKLNEQLNITGGITDAKELSDNNIGVVGTQDGGMAVKLSKNLTGLTSVSSTTFKAGDNVTLNDKGLTITNGPSVTVEGVNAGNKVITNVAAGSADTDAVNVAQLKKVQEIAAAKTTIEAGDNIKVEKGSVKGSYKISATDTKLQKGDKALSLDGTKLNLSVKDTAGNEVTGSVDLNAIKGAVDTNTYTTGGKYDAATKTIKFTRSDNATYDVDLSDVVSKVTGDTRNTIVDSDTVTVEAKAQADGSNEYKLNVKTDGKVAKGDKGIVTGGTVYKETRIEKDGNYIKAENTASQNLIALDKQVNVNATNIANLNNSVYNLGNRVDRVGAGAAALAALHPLDFDPDDKWDFAAGYGNYSGANAVAIGAYYRPNEDTMFSVGGSFGGGENMVNAGVSVKLGQGNNVTTSKIAMAKEIKDLRAEVEVLRQAIVGVGQGQELDPMKMKLFPDIEKNHWAYEAVEELAKQGLLEGYPDGTFRGDRMMTRYEFAQVVYRAMQKGLKVNEKLIQEFEPELERFRIDVISKDKDGNPVIERVRVNDKKDVAETANA